MSRTIFFLTASYWPGKTSTIACQSIMINGMGLPYEKQQNG